MRIIGILNWFEEAPNSLNAAIASAARFLDHVVALDGAYALFPGARARSGIEQQEAITAITQALGLGLTLYVPPSVWYGGEVEKRSMGFQLAEQVAQEGDWYYVIDADEVVTEVPYDLRARLEEAEEDVAEVLLWEGHDPTHPAEKYIEGASLSENHTRKFFRALPGSRVKGAHYCYCAPKNGEMVYMWGNPPGQELAPALSIRDLRTEHRNRFRDRYRARLSRDYYSLRDATGVEQLVDVYVESVDGSNVLFSPGRA